MDFKERILKEADELFCTFGVKRITMDDIARKLGMSKKTIYQHFKDKNELVYVLFESMLEVERNQMESNRQTAANAVDEVFLVVTHLQQMLSKMNPMIFFDLQKYHPQVWELFRSFRYKYMLDCVVRNISWGLEDGFYRKEINVEIIAKMRLEQVDMIFNQLVFPPSKYLLSEVLTEITEHFLYGLCTLKGHKLINKYKQVTEEQ